MSIPPGITTATIHMDAPVSFTGDPGSLHIAITSSVPLVWAATGTPLANFMDVLTPGTGQEVITQLPHTDQNGFIDGAGNAYKNWSYTVQISYEKQGQLVHFPDRSFQIIAGQTSVDLALVPTGVAGMPQVAPSGFVSSVNGQSGAVTIAAVSSTQAAGLAAALSIVFGG